MHGRASPILNLVTWSVLGALCPAQAQTPPSTITNPSYTLAGIVNAATGLPGSFSPNVIASIYGTNLAFTTHALTAADLVNGTLPTSLAGVTVYVNNRMSGLFYVSPGQINFLIPYWAGVTNVPIVVARQGLAGPVLTITLRAVSPGFFQWNGNFAIATHADGSLISPAAPAQGGEVIVLYAAGLGYTVPDILSGEVVWTASPILAAPQLRILLNGDACASCTIYYAGLTPGFAGLYQINLRLPDNLPPDPDIQMAIGAISSPAGIQLYTQQKPVPAENVQ